MFHTEREEPIFFSPSQYTGKFNSSRWLVGELEGCLGMNTAVRTGPNGRENLGADKVCV